MSLIVLSFQTMFIFFDKLKHSLRESLIVLIVSLLIRSQQVDEERKDGQH